MLEVRSAIRAHERHVLPEILQRGISTVTFVVPVFNESKRLYDLKSTLDSLRLPSNLRFKVVISDNCSDDGTTPGIARNLTIQGEKVEYVRTEETQKNSIAAARRVGTEYALKRHHEESPSESSDNRIIISFDADTLVDNQDLVIKLTEDFANNDQLMVAYGPVGLWTSAGQKIRGPSVFQRFITQELLRELFTQNNRDSKSYLNLPRDIFPGFATCMRESAYLSTRGYIDESGFADDLALSLELQRKFSAPSQIIFDKELGVLTSARKHENKRGRLSYLSLIKEYIDVMLRSRDYVPGVLNNVSTARRGQLNRRLQARDVVKDFISRVDGEIYDLKDNQEVVSIVRLTQRQARTRSDIKPAVNGATGKVIPGYYAIIRNKLV